MQLDLLCCLSFTCYTCKPTLDSLLCILATSTGFPFPTHKSPKFISIKPWETWYLPGQLLLLSELLQISDSERCQGFKGNAFDNSPLHNWPSWSITLAGGMHCKVLSCDGVQQSFKLLMLFPCLIFVEIWLLKTIKLQSNTELTCSRFNSTKLF